METTTEKTEIIDVETERASVPQVVNSGSPISTGVFDLPDPAEVARRAEQSRKMLAAACSVLSHKDITNQGGEPYIDHYGCKKIANLFGLIVRQDEKGGRINYVKKFVDEKTNNYTVSISGKVWHKSSPENYEIYEGSASSFDDFFKQWQEVEEREVNGKTKKIVVSALTLNESKVQEKATANLLQRAVKKKLGLQFSWEDLQEFGIDKNKCKGFSFNSASGETDSAELMEQKQEVWNMIVEICGGNVELAKKTLQKHTAFKDFAGHTDINKVKEKQLKVLSSLVQKEYEKYLKELEKGAKDE